METDWKVKWESKTIKRLPLQYRIFRTIASPARKFDDDLANYTILQPKIWYESFLNTLFK